jgi:hypothetical protein
MKSRYITICLCTLLLMSALALAQKTEVSVQHGKVRAATAVAAADIAAGRKATILTNEKPVVTVSDPLVDDVMKLYKWVEEEQQAQRQRIDTFNIKVISLDRDEVTTMAFLAELKNHKSRASKSFTLNSGILDEAKFYDLEGNLLSFELKQTSATHGVYTVTHSKAVEPGENFKFIGVAKRQVQVGIDADGTLRHLYPAWNTAYGLSFCRVILPPSAIFVESSRPVIAIENFQGRIAITSRAYSGPMADGKFHFAYLWPEKDNTSLTDVPGQFRGLHDPQKEAIDEEYRIRTAAIIAGQTVNDQSTPLLAMLSLYSAATHKHKQQLIDLIAKPELKAAAREYIDDVLDYAAQGLGAYVFLSTPPYPQNPQQGDKHAIHLCREGSLLHEVTAEMVFQDGKWYFWNLEEVWTPREQQEDEDVTEQTEITADPEAVAALRAKGFITEWEVAGPYMQLDTEAVDLLDIPLGPELANTDIAWHAMPVEITNIDGQDSAHLNLKRQLNDYPRQVAYLRTQIPSERDQVLRLDIRSDDAVKAWLNGRLIHANNWMRGIDLGPDAIKVKLKKGANHLMLKVTQDLFGWGAVVQLGSDKAVCPQPTGENVHPHAQVQLDWVPAVSAQAHRVYFGTDSRELPLLAEVSEAQELQPLSLKAGLSYYWRVDEVLANGSKVKGDIWSFAAGKRWAAWTFDGHARDQSAQALHGSLHGNPRWVPGVRGQAVALDREEDYIVIPPMNLNTETLTITLWVRTEEVIDNPGLVFSRNGATCAGLWFNANNNLRYNWNNDRETWLWDSGLFAPNQTWTFAALVVDTEQATIYMHDGTAMKSATHQHRHGEAAFDGVTNIGYDPGWDTVKGAIDEVQIYNYALDQAEIEAIYAKTDERP